MDNSIGEDSTWLFPLVRVYKPDNGVVYVAQSLCTYGYVQQKFLQRQKHLRIMKHEIVAERLQFSRED